MKYRVCLVLLFVLLCGLCGCKKNVPPNSTELTSENQYQPDANHEEALLGMWRNEGQYTEGHDFVETMTLSEDGTASIHLEYMGRDYATVQGTFEVSDGLLTVHITDSERPYDRIYRYLCTETELTLEDQEKTVTYIRVD